MLFRSYEDTYTLDTSVKPDYNEQDYAEDVNSVDVKWNVYVILLLRRRGLINIIEMMIDPETHSYLMRVSINNELLLHNSPETEILIDRIREEEWRENEDDFQVMRKAIMLGETRCWSEMFFETYSRVSVYCGGCRNHIHILEEDKNRFKLVKKIDSPAQEISQSIENLFGSAREAVMLTSLNDYDLLSKVIEKGFQLLVMEDSHTDRYIDILLNAPSRSNINFMGLEEYIKMLETNNHYFVSGAAIIIYDQDQKDLYKKLARIQTLSFNGHMKLLHVFEKNLYFSETQKDTVSMIDGPVFEEYDMERI